MSTTQKLWAGIAIAVIAVLIAPQGWAVAGPGGSAPATSAKSAVAPAGNGQMPADLQNALQLPAGDATRKGAVHEAAMKWVKSDPKAACDWVVGAKGNDQEPFKSMMFDWGARDGAAATAWVMGPNTKARVALHYVVTAWAGPEPEAAAAWAAKLPKGDLRKNAFNSVGEGWSRKSCPPAAAWAAKLTDEEDRHVAVRIVAGIWSYSVNKTPEPVTAWVEKLPPADIKIAALQIVPAWKDADKAKAWVGKLPLEAKDKAEILSKIK